jgi:acyl carrier protein
MNSQYREEPDSRVIAYLHKYCATTTVGASTLLCELQLDSLDLIECLFELEQYYGKTLSNAEVASLATIEDLIEAFGTMNIEKESGE